MLSPAAVRRDLLRAAGQAGTLLGGGRRVAASMVDQALERLNERSLLGFSLDGQAVSVHCLVARVIRGGLARRGRLATACRAAASALEVSAEALAKPRDHAAVREMLGQVTALLENAGTPADDADEKLASDADAASTPRAGSPDRAGRRHAARHRDRRAADRGPRASARPRPSRHPERAQQPRRSVPRRRAGSPTRSRWSSRFSPPGSGCSVPTIPAPWRRGTISPAPTGLPVGPPKPSHCSSRTWPRASGCSVPTIPGP